MVVTDITTDAHRAIQLRNCREIDKVDYVRQLCRLVELGYTQRKISRWLRISQPTLPSALQTASHVKEPVEGFSSASPLEICQRYAAGLITRDQLIDELMRWTYPPPGKTDGYNDLSFDPPGAWSELYSATNRGFIDNSVYGEVFNRRHGIGTDG